MRQIVLPFVLVVVGCAAADAKDQSPTPNASAQLPGGADQGGQADWSNGITGDGELGPGGRPCVECGAGDDDDSGWGGSSGASGSTSGGSSGSSGTSGMTSGASGTSSSGAAGASSSGSSGSSGPVMGGSGQVPAGILTAGAWDDNRNLSFFASYRNQFLSEESTAGVLGISPQEMNGAAQRFAFPLAKRVLDVSLVIDTTGSMGDEIAYLQSEFTSLVSRIHGKYPQAEQRWSLVLYKDMNDPYVVRWFDFRTDSAQIQQRLMATGAGGGGDFPEAPDKAIDIANRLSWRREEDVARVMFWVADAPHHDENVTAMTTAVRAARDKNIHIYPVASSGVNELTELTMRQTAQLTGGRYVFLTDDSGVGNDHKEPTVPCYFVTKLDQAILRMVDIELTGAYREPTSDEVIRTAGNPQGGMCRVADANVSIY